MILHTRHRVAVVLRLLAVLCATEATVRAEDSPNEEFENWPGLPQRSLTVPADEFSAPFASQGTFGWSKPRTEAWPASPEGLALAGVASAPADCPYEWRVLPAGLMYHSYLAGEKEPRFQFVPLSDAGRGMIWETALGGRTGLLRYGTPDFLEPQGWQLDLEGGVLARINPEEQDDLDAADFRAGIISTWQFGPNAYKAGYYHLSSHVGDEFLIKNPDFVRINYVRDSFITGWMRDVTLNTQVYAEFGYAFGHTGGALPFEFQSGMQYSPRTPTDVRGAPFAAANVHIRQDFGYVTAVNLVAGWQWRSGDAGQRFRTGLQFYDGPSMQYSFVNRHETLFGGGLWFDY
jgi:hypothetical protein